MKTKEVFAAEQQLRSSSSKFSGNGQWHSSLLLFMVTIMLVKVDKVTVMLVTMMIMDHLLLLTAS